MSCLLCKNVDMQKKVWSSHFITFSCSTQHQTIRLELGWAASSTYQVIKCPHSFCPTCKVSYTIKLFWFIKSACLILAENIHSWADPGGCRVRGADKACPHVTPWMVLTNTAAATSQPDGKRFHNSHNFYSRIVLAKQSTNKTFQSNVSLKRFKLCRGYYWGLLKHILDVFEIHILWLF